MTLMLRKPIKFPYSPADLSLETRETILAQ